MAKLTGTLPRSLAATLAGAVDKAALALHRSQRREVDGAVLRAAHDHYRDTFRFHWDAVLTPRREKSTLQNGIVETEFSYPSDFEPTSPEPHRARYLAQRENRVGRFRLFTKDGVPGRHTVACIFLHGYLGGFYPWEIRKFPCATFAHAGIDVALPLLPLHGARAHTKVRFPSPDPFITIEAYRQSLSEIHALVQWLRLQGRERIALVGISLGANLASLYATQQPVELLGAVTPLADLAEVSEREGAARSDEERMLVRAILKNVSPLAYPARVRGADAIIVGAAQDAITPIAHAESLAHHFESNVTLIPGAHIVATGRRDAFFEIMQRLLRTSLTRQNVAHTL